VGWETKDEREKECDMREERGERESEHVRKGGKPQEALFDREAE